MTYVINKLVLFVVLGSVMLWIISVLSVLPLKQNYPAAFVQNVSAMFADIIPILRSMTTASVV